jgi:membrane fusion protein (multidrug efflux system)
MTAAAAADDAMPAARPRRWPRRRFHLLLMFVLPLALAAGGGYAWVTGGRYVETENAYVRQAIVAIGADVAGRIDEVAVRENQAVTPGQILFRLDAEPYRLALRRAETAVEAARLEIEQLRAAHRESLTELKAAQQQLDYRRRAFERQETLARDGYAAQAAYDEARHQLQAAEERVAKASQGIERARAALGGDPELPTDRHPRVLEAIALRDQARLDLEHTTVRAPAAGIVSQTGRLRIGQYVPTGTPVLSLVETEDSWVEANVKETDLTHMDIGQPASVELDAYPGHVLAATVESIGAGTGSEFSLLPAQNATGNWVKVVQRVPVRLRIVDPPPAGTQLRAGLSADVSIDTGHTRTLPGPIRSALAATGLYPAADRPGR